MAFLRNCGIALRVLAEEGLINFHHSTDFDIWVGAREEQVGKSEFWNSLSASLPSM